MARPKTIDYRTRGQQRAATIRGAASNVAQEAKGLTEGAVDTTKKGATKLGRNAKAAALRAKRAALRSSTAENFNKNFKGKTPAEQIAEAKKQTSQSRVGRATGRAYNTLRNAVSSTAKAAAPHVETGVNAAKNTAANLESTVRQNTGSASSRANEKVRLRQNATGPNQPAGRSTGTTNNNVNRPTGANVNVARTTGQPIRQALKTGARTAGRIIKGGVIPGIALETGRRAGTNLIDTDTGRSMLEEIRGQEGRPLTSLSGFSGAVMDKLGLTGGGDTSDVSGRGTFSNLNNPDQVVPRGTSGGFFSRDANSLNPGRSGEELDAGSRTDPEQFTAANLLRGPQETPAPETAPGAGATNTTPSAQGPNIGEPDAREPNGAPRRMTLRDALSTFKRREGEDPLATAARLQARLGLASSHNASLRKTQEFDETKRQNDFSNAIDLHGAQIDEMTAQGTISKAEADARKTENTVFQSGLDNIRGSNMSEDDKAQAESDFSLIQARRNKFDPESSAVQTMFATILRDVANEEDGSFLGASLGKLVEGVTPDALGGTAGFGPLKSVFAGDTPLLTAENIRLFSVDSDGNLNFRRGNGVETHVVSLEDLPQNSAQFLQEVMAKRRQSLRQ